MRKQVETEVNTRVQAAEQERDELWRWVEYNERILQEILSNINFQPSATPSLIVIPSQRTDMDLFQRYCAQGSQQGWREDNDGEDEDEEEEEH